MAFRTFRQILLMLSFLSALFGRNAQAQDLDSLVSSLREKHKLPAFGALLIMDGEVKDISVSGVRKMGDPTPATTEDTWHLGSDTKAFTATLIGILVDRGALRWDLTLAEAFPELSDKMHPDFRSVTLEMLLSHHAGMPSETWPKGHTYHTVLAFEGNEFEQRYKYTELILAQAPEVKPRTKAIYSNAGYAIAGAVAERVTGKSYYELLDAYILRPLGITSAGMGPVNTPGKVDQPWGHEARGLLTIPYDAVTGSDNPPAIAPAGRLHMTLRDWSRFAMLHLGIQPEPQIISEETLHALHTKPFGGDFALGWLALERKWANGPILTHDGSNTLNYASAWLAPGRKFALLMISNVGGNAAMNACQDLATAIVLQHYVKK
jgi:CubicO group peptidase (beta-lactamase class C family)